MNPILLAEKCNSAHSEPVDMAELLSLNLRNPAVEKTPWKIGYRQVSFGFIKRERTCIRELQSTEFDIDLGQDSRTIFLNNDL